MTHSGDSVVTCLHFLAAHRNFDEAMMDESNVFFLLIWHIYSHFSGLQGLQGVRGQKGEIGFPGVEGPKGLEGKQAFDWINCQKYHSLTWFPIFKKKKIQIFVRWF